MLSIASRRALSRMHIQRSFKFQHSIRNARPQLLSHHQRPTSYRAFASLKSVDERIEEIQDQYGTAQDEFEIATEETEKMSVYAEEDRRAAREEFDKLQTLYESALNDEGGEEVRQRVGQRIRELKNAVEHLEETAKNQD